MDNFLLEQCDEFEPDPTFDDLQDVAYDDWGRPLAHADSLMLREMDEIHFERLADMR